jgi:hypothetical protein
MAWLTFMFFCSTGTPLLFFAVIGFLAAIFEARVFYAPENTKRYFKN